MENIEQNTEESKIINIDAYIDKIIFSGDKEELDNLGDTFNTDLNVGIGDLEMMSEFFELREVTDKSQKTFNNIKKLSQFMDIDLIGMLGVLEKQLGSRTQPDYLKKVNVFIEDSMFRIKSKLRGRNI